MQSNLGTKTLKLMNSLEAIEKELEINYKRRKLKNEKVQQQDRQKETLNSFTSMTVNSPKLGAELGN